MTTGTNCEGRGVGGDPGIMPGFLPLAAIGGRDRVTQEGRDVGLSGLAHFDLGDATGIGNGLGAGRDTGADYQEG